MFERYITDALTTNFGHIVENVDADKMRLSAWKGELNLDDVSLKRNALDALFFPSNDNGSNIGSSSGNNQPRQQCPVEIEYGHVGNFHVKIPWKLLTSQWSWQNSSGNDKPMLLETNCSIVLTDVNILIVPRRKVVNDENSTNNDENELRRQNDKHEHTSDNGEANNTQNIIVARRAEKEREVQSMLDANLLQRVTESSVSTSRGWTWLQDWLSSILSTLSVTVRNIHIRYEDPGTSMGFEWKIFNFPSPSRPFPSGAGNSLNGNSSDSGSAFHDLEDENDDEKDLDFLQCRQSVLQEQRRYRPAFAVGIKLKEFSVRSTSDEKIKASVQIRQESSVLSSSAQLDGEEDEEESCTIVETATIATVSSSHDIKVSPKQKKKQTDPNKVNYISRQKLAAAEDLAVYWDSDTSLVATRAYDSISKESGSINVYDSLPTRQKLFQFYRLCFEILNINNNDRMADILSNDMTKAGVDDARNNTYNDESHLDDNFMEIIEDVQSTVSLLRKTKHSYLLDPISPSLQIILVSQKPRQSRGKSAVTNDGTSTTTEDRDIDGDGKGKNRSSTQEADDISFDGSEYSPPSSIHLDLPPCKFTIARSTLEDIVYVRKSLSVWTHASKTLLSETTLRRLANLRPELSPLQDPSGWWLYAFKATIILSRATEEQGRGNSTSRNVARSITAHFIPDDIIDGPRPLLRRKGWRGLVEAVSRRRKYVRLYEKLLDGSRNEDLALELEAHEALFTMEDGLLSEEIVSFRLYLYETLSAKYGSDYEDHDENQRSTDEIEDPQVAGRGETDAEILSPVHRLWMYSEMKQALDRERKNRQNQEMNDLKRVSINDVSVLALEDQANPLVGTVSVVCREVAIQINDESFNRHHKSHSGRSVWINPVVRASCAWVQDHSWYQDGSWDADCSLGSLEVKDLISARGKTSSSRYLSTLLGHKTKQRGKRGLEDEYLLINGIRYSRSVAVTVTKRLRWAAQLSDDNIDRGSTTTTKIRVLPMELVYSTLPAEAVSRVLSTIRTPELVDDYHKVLAAANSWREEQKKKLFEALARRDKKIIVDVDIGAPEYLIPEDIYRTDSPMLAINLGRFQIFNDDESYDGSNSSADDDKWRIVVSDVQVRNTCIASYFSRNTTDHRYQQLVEPFSINFAVSTRISEDRDALDDDGFSRFSVSATLPRLAFNVTSSSIRLFSRLRRKWELRKRERANDFDLLQPPGSLLPSGKQEHSLVGHNGWYETKKKEVHSLPNRRTLGRDRVSRIFTFDFSAPIITLKMENDVDEISSSSTFGHSRHRSSHSLSTPLLDLSLRRIKGTFVQEAYRSGLSEIQFHASLQSLGAIDQYQTAGPDYVLFLSSVPQSSIIDEIYDGSSYSWDRFHASYDTESGGRDLVKVQYRSTSMDDSRSLSEHITEVSPEKLMVSFHQLFVQWNPETLAAVQRAIRVPVDDVGFSDHQISIPETAFLHDNESISDEDEFYDAHDALEDEQFYDANDGESSRSSVRTLSEISSAADEANLKGSSEGPLLTGVFSSIRSLNPLTPDRPGGVFSPRLVSSPASNGSPIGPRYLQEVRLPSVTIPKLEELSPEKNKQRSLVVKFELSKLRVSFNRETRRRKMMVAQMDGTSVSYETKINGGSKTLMRIGNLAFLDPAHEKRDTLYGQILGLKTDSDEITHRAQSSLLQMEILLNPHSRQYSCTLGDNDISKCAKIDREGGRMEGCDCCVRANFSPMRFVLLEQLWFEIMDYFFQGIMGTEVWTGKPAETSKVFRKGSELLTDDKKTAGFLPGSDASGISFTRFDISLDTPTILLPVTYSSPEFVRLDLSEVRITNKYVGSIVNDAGFGVQDLKFDRMQWFNNCDISLNDLRLFTWSGRELGTKSATGKVTLRWPVGPYAPLIIPKWNVACSFDGLAISLRRCDYALLQNMISYNIGEPSRNMEEWDLLQSLSPDVLNALLQGIIVHFGYDKKDVTPTTYDLVVEVPALTFGLLESEKVNSTPVAVARFFDLQWRMRKESDLITKQSVRCDIDIVYPNADLKLEKLLSLSKYDADFDSIDADAEEGLPGLAYTSTTLTSGDSYKTLEITDACIYMVVPAWSRFISFFRSIPPPIILTPTEIGTSIQVGDRWYRIGDMGTPSHNQYSSVFINDGGGVSLNQKYSWITDIGDGVPQKESPTQSSPRFQMKVLLSWPRIVISSTQSTGTPRRIILRMKHLEFLYTNDSSESRTSTTLFVHDVEVYTSSGESTNRALSKAEQNSLINPWNLAVSIEQSTDTDRIFHKKIYKLSGDMLRARAAYSDMAIAVDIVMCVLHSMKEESMSLRDEAISHPIYSGSFDGDEVVDPDDRSSLVTDDGLKDPTDLVERIFTIHCDGFDLVVADDSGRHFAGAQELARLSLGTILLSHTQSKNGDCSMRIRLHTFNLFDCLQPPHSPFALAASSQSKLIDVHQQNQADSTVSSIPSPNDTRDRQGMYWDGFKVIKDGTWNNITSPTFKERLAQASHACLRMGHEIGGASSTTGLVELSSNSSGNEMQEYDLKVRSLMVQWNPSTVIAIQRFLGRLKKESKDIARHVFHTDLDDFMKKDEPDITSEKPSNKESNVVVIRGRVAIDSFVLCLNKEHQNRRLLEMTFSSCNATLRSSSAGLSVDGRIGDLDVVDADISGTAPDMLPSNRSFLTVLPRQGACNNDFLRIVYKTFDGDDATNPSIPAWVVTHLQTADGIDDFLSLSVAATRFTYLKERTDEILDYLSNGLPGKGMGVTSRAAKGFISKRIQTKSFLEVNIDSPQVFVPRHETRHEGISLTLGDTKMKSWFESRLVGDLKHEAEWFRILSFELSGFKCGLIRNGSNFRQLSSPTQPVDLDILLQKAVTKGSKLTVEGRLSSLETTFHYSDYILLRAVISDNIGRRIDKDKWDNVEKAYWLEEVKEKDTDTSHETPKEEHRVVYSSNARFVRYGKLGKQGQKEKSTASNVHHGDSLSDATEGSSTLLDVRFELEGLSMKLRRDDLVEGISENIELLNAFHYDVALLRVGSVELVASSTADGDFSFNASFFQLGLFDLGDTGRLLRERYYNSLPSTDSFASEKRSRFLRQPCPFQVLAEGYESEKSDATPEVYLSESKTPQFVVTMNTCHASSTTGFGSLSNAGLPPDTKVTVVRVVINSLSVNALIRPFREIVDFISCKWLSSLVTLNIELEEGRVSRSGDKDPVAETGTAETRGYGFQFKFVAHYPRVFFVADESDPSSRALVLRGLAVVDVSDVKSIEYTSTRRSDTVDCQKTTVVSSQLHELETYINPDVSKALMFSHRHAEMVGENYIGFFHQLPHSGAENSGKCEKNGENDDDLLGIALIQPVTAGIEYTRVMRELFPTTRSLYITVEPVSTMLSFEDLQLIEVVVNRWSSSQKSRNKIVNEINEDQEISNAPIAYLPSNEKVAKHFVCHDVIFVTDRLGLGLRSDDEKVEVSSVQNPLYKDQVHRGDIIVSVGGEDVRQKPLDVVVRLLSLATRPVTIKFQRLVVAENFKHSAGNSSTTCCQKEEEMKNPSDETDDEKAVSTIGPPLACYSLRFQSGLPLGLDLERSVCAQFPVVTRVHPTIDDAMVMSSGIDSLNQDQFEIIESTFQEENTRLPKVGAIIVAVDGVLVDELGVEEAWAALSRLQRSLDESGDVFDRGMPASFSLTFQEINQSVWGHIDTVDISTSGMAFSFIDDLGGRSLPLVRGKVNSLDVHVKRGLGIDAHILDYAIPTILSPLDISMADGDSDMFLSAGFVKEIQTESILSASCIGRLSVDYFHPRSANFEPLLEPSQLFLLLEKQGGSVENNRPAQLALEASDRLLRDHFFRGNARYDTYDGEAHMVSLNVTDAAAEVIMGTIKRWKEWRESVSSADQQDLDEEIDQEPYTKDPSERGLRPTISTDSSINEDSGTLNDEAAQSQYKSQKAAAKKAAQAALVFAQKRGAVQNKKSESAKPFIFRNRTGVSVAFVQQGRELKKGRYQLRGRRATDLDRSLSTSIGEYCGLEEYDVESVTEVADQGEAKFDMDFADGDGDESSISMRSVRHITNKVRSYEGRYPDLTVAIQAVAGVVIEPLRGLPVIKVGSTLRHLVVYKVSTAGDSKDSSDQYTINLVWKVAIEDNRRILTLSTAVCVVSTGFNMPIEVGVRRTEDENDTALVGGSEPLTRTIGIARSNSPLYVPLWLALKLEPVTVFIRPASSALSDYIWSDFGIIRFGPAENPPFTSGHSRTNGVYEKWTWEETFYELDRVRCLSRVGEDDDAIWITVFGSPFKQENSLSSPRNHKGRRRMETIRDETDFEGVMTVACDSALTIRNLLPMSIEWEVAELSDLLDQKDVDGTTKRRSASLDSKALDEMTAIQGEQHFGQFSVLKSGECTEVMGCSGGDRPLQARFKQLSGRTWSTWAPLNLEESSNVEDDVDRESKEALIVLPSQVNVQIRDPIFGTPLVLGVRIVPKLTGDSPYGLVYGLEIIVYAELWIRNITSLPLNFGCPFYQMHQVAKQTPSIERTESDDMVAKFAAESALMEISNLLEVGDKGIGLNQKAIREVSDVGFIESLPDQECSLLFEEVFEYIEIESSLVKRRWYGSESYACYREKIVGVSDEQSKWKWIDEHWAIDCSGGAKPSTDGWESCRNMLSEEGTFASSRQFQSSHAFRRRRFFRSRNTDIKKTALIPPSFELADHFSGLIGKRHMGGIQAFHQPLQDSFSREQYILKRKRGKRGDDREKDKRESGAFTKISVKCGDGQWSMPATIPDRGTCHGVLSVYASRWPELTKLQESKSSHTIPAGPQILRAHSPQDHFPEPFIFKSGCLEPRLYDLCYTVTDVDGEWGEFSRMMDVSPRFVIRNDSKRVTMKLKQTGSQDSSALTLLPGEAEPFYWSDFRLPKLVSVLPAAESDGSLINQMSACKWSGGFDLCNLGMLPVRIRCESNENKNSVISSVRVLVEVRNKTGGFGINISVREEDPEGEGALFRIENDSPFSIWLAQDGILSSGSVLESARMDGDILRPLSKTVYALDVPFRQGKYAHRKEATLDELLQVRIALAPLCSRAGMENMKVLRLSTVGESIRLNPSKLPLPLTDAGKSVLLPIRVLGVVTTDGPTRVLRFVLMSHPDGSYSNFGNVFDDMPLVFSQVKPSADRLIGANKEDYSTMIAPSVEQAIRMSQNTTLPTEIDAKRKAMMPMTGLDSNEDVSKNAALDTIYSFRAEFSGFLFSLVDSSPSEIAVASLRNFNILARWNALRSTDASMIFSVGWLQVDNHIPSAPFKVAVRPDTSVRHGSSVDQVGGGGNTLGADKTPLLVVALAFAPKHKSDILVLRSVTVAPRNLVIAIDLAFLVRLQRFFIGLLDHFNSSGDGTENTYVGSRSGSSFIFNEHKKTLPFPLLGSPDQKLAEVGSFNENRKLYFQGLTILPTNIKLSVAPARALTPEQANLEGKEAAAIHQAVRKGDVLVGGSTNGPLGVRIGRKNTTPLAVVRGVFKSFIVDALLRLDGANLNFPGVFLRNHIATGSQLTTFLLAHYISSLKQNVPALLGSLAAIGNPLGLLRGVGEGVSDFVNEPVKGFKRSLKELDPGYVVDGVARGTESLARHTVGGLADSASLLTETFSKYMAVVTLDRRYAQKRDRQRNLRNRSEAQVTLVGGVESGFLNLIQGFREGVTGVVRAPMRGAEKRGLEGFAKGLGKGLLGLLVKPIIGISDAATDLMIGVKSTVEYKEELQQSLALLRNQVRPRRPMYGRDKVLRPYRLEDAAASTLMLRTRCAGENYLSHMDMNDRVALLSVKRLVILGSHGEELMELKYSHIDSLEVRPIDHGHMKHNDDRHNHRDGGMEAWGIVVVLNKPRRNGSDIEVISCQSYEEASELCALLRQGVSLAADDAIAA